MKNTLNYENINSETKSEIELAFFERIEEILTK